MGVFIITFSPTSGSKAVAKALVSGVTGEIGQVDLLKRTVDFSAHKFGPEDLCVVAMPVYGGRVPAVAMERLGQMTGGGAAAVAVAVFGNRAIEDALVELADGLAAAGFRVCAGVSAVAEHSIMRQFAAGRPNSADWQELAGFGARIREKLASADWQMPVLPGNRPYKERHRIAMNVQAGDGCIGCGACEVHCPVGAIPFTDPGQTDPEICISCMGCVDICPQQARFADPQLVKASIQRLSAACEGRKPNELFL